MGLAINLLLTILIELPIIALFFKRKRRQKALLMGLLVNIVSWSVAHIILFSTDINISYVAVALGIAEAIAFHMLLECSWKTAIIMSLVINSLSFYATQLIPVDVFQSKPDVIRTGMLLMFFGV